jgi:hypothetical protein
LPPLGSDPVRRLMEMLRERFWPTPETVKHDTTPEPVRRAVESRVLAQQRRVHELARLRAIDAQIDAGHR